MSSTLLDQTAERRAKRDALQAQGINPYPTRFERSATLAELQETHREIAPDTRTGEEARVAGRVVSMRGHGKLRFVTIEDSGGTVQLMFQADRLPADAAAVEALVDLGDWIGASGEVITSRRGQLSIDVRGLEILAKSLRPLPDKWHGLSEAETRYRQREVDLLANKDSRRVFDIRFRTLSILRDQLATRNFLEVETPILQPQAGGALARPFFTHANALDTDFSLRIAPELFLKRLVVGGYERVFEIARNFRNEGIDTRHSPEFTSLEAYRAFGDFRDGMDLTEHLIVEAAKGAVGRLEFDVGGRVVDLTPPWPRRDLLDMLQERLGERVHPSMPVERLREICAANDVAYLPAWGPGKLVFELYDQLLMGETAGPVFIYHYPDGGLSARPPVPRGPHGHRPLRAGHRGPGAGQRIQRAQRPRRAGEAVRGRGGSGPGRRRRGAPGRRRLRAGARVRAPADVRHRHRHRPADHAPRRGLGDPRRHSLPDHATGDSVMTRSKARS